MISAFARNDLLLSMLATLAGDSVDLEEAEKAFKVTAGDFRTKFTAAVQARLAQLAEPEIFVELPEDPDQVRKADLEELVRPAAYGFLRSYPAKSELVDQVALIRHRQERRPAWIPRVDQDGEPIRPEPDSNGDERAPDKPLAVAALAELGEVTVWLPEAWEDRPELPMAPGGIGEWESALYAFLGMTGENSPASTIAIDADANEALAPAERRWRSTGPVQPVPAANDPGVASELLATSRTLGGLPVTDDNSQAYEVVADALMCAGDWRYSPRWLLETWSHADGTPTRTVARATIAGRGSQRTARLRLRRRAARR